MPLNSMYWLAPDFSIRSIDLSAQNKTLGPHKSTLNFLECSSLRTSGAKEENFDVGEERMGDGSCRDEIVAVRWGEGWGGRRSRMGNEERGEVLEGEGGVVGAIEWVGVEVEDGFAVGGGDYNHGFW